MVFTGPFTLARTALAVTYKGKSLDWLKTPRGGGWGAWQEQGSFEAKGMRGTGVLHIDLALRDMVVDPEQNSLKLIAFGSAEVVQTGSEDEQRMALEMENVSRLIGGNSKNNTKKGRRRRRRTFFGLSLDFVLALFVSTHAR
eukprot:CAMPEP_0184530804 /NCGR_PEP_ID=MMETSP0198_2-20121128/13167_1 /TAXON_ID=1112570 /ORGANISM="Thraustochytrium sp., Strain LLF1b" /LENGTH=141 /DNA_ID=CAMNT_0026923035 /DNA_START=465 /DNA_END=890 /DNA_ORIENTATION=+